MTAEKVDGGHPDGLEDPERTRRLRGDLRAHLLSWDPMGVGHEPQAEDKYEAFVSPLLHLLYAGKPEAAVATYLATVAEDCFGLRSHPERERRCAAALVAWWAVAGARSTA